MLHLLPVHRPVPQLPAVGQLPAAGQQLAVAQRPDPHLRVPSRNPVAVLRPQALLAVDLQVRLKQVPAAVDLQVQPKQEPVAVDLQVQRKQVPAAVDLQVQRKQVPAAVDLQAQHKQVPVAEPEQVVAARQIQLPQVLDPLLLAIAVLLAVEELEAFHWIHQAKEEELPPQDSPVVHPAPR